jgi:hypothetical protein
MCTTHGGGAQHRDRLLVKKGEQVRRVLSSKHVVLIQALVGLTFVRKHAKQEGEGEGEAVRENDKYSIFYCQQINIFFIS